MYFTNFPQTTYNGIQCIDLTRRTKIVETLQRQPVVFYPYQLSPGQRPDTLAYDYYNDSSAEWAVLQGNQIMDPYYGWYLAQEDFNDYLIDKYGSIEEAAARIHHWETNWAEVTYNISVDYFNGLPDVMKKYWIPNFGVGATILSYSRRQDNWTQVTNQIVQLGLDATPGFQQERVAFFNNNDLFQATPALAEITYVDPVTGNVDVQNIQGNIQVGLSMIGQTTGASANVTSITVLQTIIDPVEASFWEPVTMLDYETGLNEQNKFVMLIDNNFYRQFETDLRTKLNA